jgi:hypothetical protein
MYDISSLTSFSLRLTYNLVYTRTVKEYESYALKNFRIRFKTLDELSLEYGKDADSAVIQQNDKLKKERQQEMLLQHVVSESYVPKRDDSYLSPILDVEEKLNNQIRQGMKHTFQHIISNHLYLGVNFTPWFDKYREEYLNSFYVSDHEMWEHPLACITIVGSDDPNPVTTHRELYNADRPPKLFTDKYVDADLFRIYVMLHDCQNGPSDNR